MVIVKIIGGLGNQLFQYAAARNISVLKQVPLKVDTTFYADIRNKRNFRLTHYNTVIEEAKKEEIESLITEPSSLFYAIVYRKLHINSKFYKKAHIIEKSGRKADDRLINCDGNAYIEGWFQNEEYFKEIKSVLLNEFSLKKGPDAEFQNIQSEIGNCESVSIHFRRGDYLTNKFFGVVSLDYYYRTVAYIKKSIKHPVFYVFSDDIEWVKKNFDIAGTVRFLDSDSDNDFKDLTLMSYCKHNIIANSTFSWWAAWLNTNPGKIVIAPKRWYDDPQAQKCYEEGRLKVFDWIYI